MLELSRTHVVVLTIVVLGFAGLMFMPGNFRIGALGTPPASTGALVLTAPPTEPPAPRPVVCRSATCDCYTGKIREFYVNDCRRNFTISQLYQIFAAHQVEWSIYGKTEVWWSVMLHPGMKSVTDLPEKEKRDFYNTGVFVANDSYTRSGGAEFFDARRKEQQAENKTLSVLDFGCGVGRLAFGLASYFDEVTCVDQSVYHLRTAAAEWPFYAQTRPAKMHFVTSTPDLLAALDGVKAPNQYDFVHSMIALQHAVTPLQTMYLEQLCDILKPGGRTYLQLPHIRTRPGEGIQKCTDELIEESIRRGGMQWHYTTMQAMKAIMNRRGCTGEVRDTGQAGHGANAIIVMTKTGRAE